MSSNRNWQQKLAELEAEIESGVNRISNSASQQSNTETRPHIEINPSPRVKDWLNSGKNWFETLPKVGKIAVGIGGLWLGVSILTAFIHLVSSLVSIAIVGFILYLGYKFVLNSDDAN